MHQVVSTLSILEPFRRVIGGIPFLYQRVSSTSPVTALISPKPACSSLAVVHLDGSTDWMVIGRSLLAWTGQTLSVRPTLSPKLVRFMVHKAGLKADLDGEELRALGLKATSFRLQIPDLGLSTFFPDTKFFRVIRESWTWNVITGTAHSLRTRFRRSIWGDRLFLQFQGPATILLQTRAVRLNDVLTNREVNEIAEAPGGSTSKVSPLITDISDKKVSQQVTKPLQMSTAIFNVGNMRGIRVVARIRPQHSSEVSKDCILSATGPDGDANSTVVRIPSFKNQNETFSFQFSSVYDQASTQQTIFDNEITPTIKHLFNGFDVTIFAYGVTGTGKTHTMRGGKSLAERGIIPRLLSSTYRRCRKIEKDSKGETSVGITLSYYEIYNDKVFDLLEAPEKRTMSGLHLRDNGGKTVVVGLTERPCESLKDFEKMYDDANVNRSTSATKLNAHSSRSHAILCFKVTMTTGEEVRVSTASAIDLAGSEDNRRTDNGKERLVESASINKSLFVLAKCVEAISQKQTRIPYRESKMTRILSLGQNNGLTVMILNLAPGRSYHLDTLSSLNFANRTKKIEIRELENEPLTKGCSRAVPTEPALSMHRQPLRAIASTVHNTAMGSKANPKQEGKPTKMFSVYSDRPKTSFMATQGSKDTTKRSSPLKRPLEAESSVFNRPAKRRSPDGAKRHSDTMSKEVIVKLIDEKVKDMLATRAMDHSTAGPVAEIGEDVQRRLELLEKKLDGRDEEQGPGLEFLLMARQHTVRGEDKSALRMYLLARDHFPGNTKLASKIEKLQSKLQGKQQPRQRNAEANENAVSRDEPARQGELGARNRDKETSMKDDDRLANDDDYRAESEGESEEGYESADSFRYRPKRGKGNKRKAANKMCMEEATACPDSPRTKQLLSIINSRDVGQIRLLGGVGAKRAEAMVEALCGDEEGDGSCRVLVSSLAQLGQLRGVGVRTVEKMRSGLGIS
ncbi:MAG: hypothetical protein Q9169_002495 [Polycauliona sp. 2 TL-2023]